MFTKSEIKVVDLIRKNSDTIMRGTFLAVDPASKSLGYALFCKGKLNQSGVVEAPSNLSISQRLFYMIASLERLPSSELVAIEKVRSGTGHIYLTWAAGAAVGAVNSAVTLEIPVTMWKKVAGDKHQKSDENDAIAIGNLLIYVCKELECLS